MSLTDYELVLIQGGASGVSGSLLNAISKLINTLFDLGRSVGSSLNYRIKKTKC